MLYLKRCIASGCNNRRADDLDGYCFPCFYYVAYNYFNEGPTAADWQALTAEEAL